MRRCWHRTAGASADGFGKEFDDTNRCAIATSNGAVMVNFYPSFVDERWRRLWKSTEKERDALRAVVEAGYRERGEPVPYSVQMQVDRDYYAAHSGEMHLPGIEEKPNTLIAWRRWQG